MKLRHTIGVAILLFQLAAIAYARFVPSRYFCWAPYDAQNDYTIEVTIGDQALTATEIQARYRKRARGTDNRAIQHIKDIIAGYEARHGIGDHAQVTLRYRVNGAEEHTWTFPPR